MSMPSRSVDALPNGTALEGYLVTGLIGQGGFGVVYLARNTRSNQTVAIKEFLPTAVAGRLADGRIVPINADMEHAYASGLKGFLREANLLSEFAHPALVAVDRAWEQNGTAYMAMQYYPGKTLREVRTRNAAPLSEVQIKAWMLPVFEAVSELHAHRVIHRDVSPDNVLVMASGDTVLLDLGAARQVLGGMTQALTTILKPGFAPIEQYVQDGSMEQGRWTDVYGLGAVIYFLVTGKPPTPATSRIVRDSLPPLETLAPREMYSPAFFAAVTKALSLRAIERFKSINEFRTALGWVVQRQIAPAPIALTTTTQPMTAAQVLALNALPLQPTRRRIPANATSRTEPEPMAALRDKGKAAGYSAPSQTTAKVWVAVALGAIIAVSTWFALH